MSSREVIAKLKEDGCRVAYALPLPKAIEEHQQNADYADGVWPWSPSISLVSAASRGA